jgi:phage shock protein PspC (stress-responsive transcriptional regulator)
MYEYPPRPQESLDPIIRFLAVIGLLTIFGAGMLLGAYLILATMPL